jgi:hypothetical protein
MPILERPVEPQGTESVTKERAEHIPPFNTNHIANLSLERQRLCGKGLGIVIDPKR